MPDWWKNEGGKSKPRPTHFGLYLDVGQTPLKARSSPIQPTSRWVQMHDEGRQCPWQRVSLCASGRLRLIGSGPFQDPYMPWSALASKRVVSQLSCGKHDYVCACAAPYSRPHLHTLLHNHVRSRHLCLSSEHAHGPCMWLAPGHEECEGIK